MGGAVPPKVRSSRAKVHSQAVFVLPEPGDKVGSVVSSA